MKNAVTDNLESISGLMFSELMLLAAIDALGAIAVCLLFWPKIMIVFMLEALFAIATIIVARQIIWRTTNQIDAISEGVRSFSEDASFRFDAEPGSLEDSLNMWMDSVSVATDVEGDLHSIDTDAKRIELISDGMLSNIVPRDADMILEVRASATHIQAIVASRK